MAKPVGRTGPFNAEVLEDGTVRGSYERIQFPTAKDEIEKLLAQWFIHSMSRATESADDPPFFTDLKPNAESDFDFTVRTARGPAFLELQEAAPLAGPYETAPASYKPYDFAQRLFAKICEKSMRYPTSGVRDIFLLVYVTHWSFVLSTSTITCLRVWLNQTPTVFRAIFTFTPRAWGEGELRWIYPVPPELREGFDPESIRDNICLNLDSAKFEVVQKREP